MEVHFERGLSNSISESIEIIITLIEDDKNDGSCIGAALTATKVKGVESQHLEFEISLRKGRILMKMVSTTVLARGVDK